MAQVCPVVGTTTSVLPPGHPSFDIQDSEARCPVTNAKVEHHGQDIIHSHPDSAQIPDERTEAMDASACPAVKGATSEKLVDGVCPVVGAVSTYLPPSHPAVDDGKAGEVCPVTNATLEHHKKKVKAHPKVADNAPAQSCPVASNMLPSAA